MTPLIVDEATTVAMAFALAGFATDPLHVSSSGTSLARTGEANAFTNASHLASVNTGIVPAMLPSGAATVPQTTINTLANILFSCIHSRGSSSSACQSLFSSAGSAGPYSDTASAALGIAHSPASSVSMLFAQQPTTPPFAPYLAAAPNDFSLGLVFTRGGLTNLASMAVDGEGDVWVVSSSGAGVTKISSSGSFLSGSAGFPAGLYGAGPIAIDVQGNAWIANGTSLINGQGSIVELSGSGAVLSGTKGFPSSGPGLQTPAGLAIDASGSVWVSNQFGDNISKFLALGKHYQALMASREADCHIRLR